MPAYIRQPHATCSDHHARAKWNEGAEGSGLGLQVSGSLTGWGSLLELKG